MPSKSSSHLQKIDWLSMLVLCISVLAVSYFSPVDYSEFDPLGTLLTSQSLLHGTIKLDEYRETIATYPWQIQAKNDHAYYHYPIGTPLLVAPVVWFANFFGKDMARRADDVALQNLLSALTTMLACFLIYLICRQYVSTGHSILLCAAFVGGSSIISTMGSALYNINLSVIFVLLCLLFVTVDEMQRQERNPYLLGICLFLAYLCRPTAAIFIFFIFIYLFIKSRMQCCKSMITFILLGGIFIGFSWCEYRQILPDYYLPSKLGEDHGKFWTAVAGNLFSPMRGILIYSPFLLFTVYGSFRYFPQLRRFPLYWLSIGWFLSHLAVISRNFMWWGGASLGNRLFTDGVPSLLLLTLLVWHVASQRISALKRRCVIGIVALLVGGSVFMNTYQGLYNTYTIDWGAEEKHLFDWEYPQFFANHKLLAKRETRDQLPLLEPYNLGERIEPNSRNAIFSSWYWVENNFRWSRGNWAKILFTLQSLEIQSDKTLRLDIQVGAYGQQRVELVFNGEKIGEVACARIEPTTYTFSIESALIKGDKQYNELEFLLPDAINPHHFYGKGWVRSLGISFWSARLDYSTP